METIERKGSVWLGVIGRPLSPQNHERLKKQAEYLYLVQWRKGRCQAYKGTFADIADSLLPEERDLAPAYYGVRNIFSQAKMWVKLTHLEKINAEELATLSVSSTGTRVPALARSMTSLAMVVRDVDEKIAAIGQNSATA
jgi:hypothetical protein